MEVLVDLPSRAEQKMAQNCIDVLETKANRNLKKNVGQVKISIQNNIDAVAIPKKAVSLLYEILANMAKGKSVKLIPSNEYLTTQQAADFLNVSRPHFVQLLEKGKMPYKKVGSHRRIKVKDLLAYEAKTQQIKEKNLTLLAKQAQKLNLGY